LLIFDWRLIEFVRSNDAIKPEQIQNSQIKNLKSFNQSNRGTAFRSRETLDLVHEGAHQENAAA